MEIPTQPKEAREARARNYRIKAAVKGVEPTNGKPTAFACAVCHKPDRVLAVVLPDGSETTRHMGCMEGEEEILPYQWDERLKA